MLGLGNACTVYYISIVVYGLDKPNKQIQFRTNKMTINKPQKPDFILPQLIIGGACGAVVCIALVAVGAAYVRCRNTSRAQSQPLPQRTNPDDDTKLREFHKQLDCLRVSMIQILIARGAGVYNVSPILFTPLALPSPIL